jgi:hypothetical protein
MNTTQTTNPAYTATMEAPCSHCAGPTIPPTPGHPEEQGYYCERCGTVWAGTGTQGRVEE